MPLTRGDPGTHLWEAPWAGPQSGSGSASTATYGPIYNPAAPPPSANYTAMASNYSGKPYLIILSVSILTKLFDF